MMHKILIIIFVSLLYFFYIFLCLRQTAWPLGSEMVKPGLPSYNAKEAKQKMLYHGTLVAQRDLKTGEWFFYREGKKCHLK